MPVYDCQERISTIPLPQGGKGRLYGVELEVELPGPDPSDRECECTEEELDNNDGDCCCTARYGRGDLTDEDCSEDLDYRSLEIERVCKDKVICKYDGSLNHGFEVVSRPGTVKAHHYLWPKVINALPTGTVSHNTETCGLHIHIDRTGLSQLTIGKILVFFNSGTTSSLITAVARRSAGRYCYRYTKRLTDGKSTRYNDDRYQAVNLCNLNTVEIRIFRGTICLPTILASIEFVDAVVAFCQDISESLTNWSSEYGLVSGFLHFVQSKTNKDKWPNLIPYLVKRNVLKGANHVSIDR